MRDGSGRLRNAGEGHLPTVIDRHRGTGEIENATERVTTLIDALEAVAAGAPVSLWLTGEASWLAVPGRAAEVALPHGAPLADLLEIVLAAGSVTLCTQCAQRRDLTGADLLPGVRIAGAATFVAEVLAPEAQALVY